MRMARWLARRQYRLHASHHLVRGCHLKHNRFHLSTSGYQQRNQRSVGNPPPQPPKLAVAQPLFALAEAFEMAIFAKPRTNLKIALKLPATAPLQGTAEDRAESPATPCGPTTG